MNETIKTIEESQTMVEAAKKLGVTKQYLYFRLKENNLKVIRETKLKVVGLK